MAGKLTDSSERASVAASPSGGVVIGGSATQRLDKWLWYARIAKSRTLAAGLVSRGKVRINRVRAEKPSQAVRRGDVVTVAVGRTIRVLKIEAPGKRRGPAAEARLLYEELTAAEDKPKSAATALSGGGVEGGGVLPGGAARPPGSGRPTKKERRLLDKWRSMPE